MRKEALEGQCEHARKSTREVYTTLVSVHTRKLTLSQAVAEVVALVNTDDISVEQELCQGGNLQVMTS